MQIRIGTIECPLASGEAEKLQERARQIYRNFLDDPVGQGRDEILNIGKDDLEELSQRKTFDTPESAKEMWVRLHSAIHMLGDILRLFEGSKDDGFEFMMAGEIEDDVKQHIQSLGLADNMIRSIYMIMTNPFRRRT